MKKLMIAAAALTAGIAMAADGIVSTDIVGYAQSGLQTGFTMMTPQFLSTGSDAMPLQSLTPVGDDTSDAVFVQTLDAGGYTVNSYTWNDWATDEPCWVNDDYEPIEGVSFPSGTGLWVQGAATGQGIRSAGKVGTSDVVIQLQTGFTAGGNPFPVDVKLQDITAEGDDTSDSVFIQTLDAGGYTVDTYTWNDWAADEPCWVNDDYEPIEGVSFAAGAGLWIQGASNAQYIRIPAPEF